MERKNNGARRMISFDAVFVGLLFFLNPFVRLFDVLPDTFGCLLIYAGLRKAADADSYFSDARKYDFIMLWVSLIKAALALFLATRADRSLAMPLTFLALVPEVILYAAFADNLFKGFEYTAMRLDNEGKVASRVGDVRFICVLFLLARGILGYLPETVTLIRQSEEFDLNATRRFDIPTAAVYKYVLALCLLVTVVLGVVCFVKLIGFFGAVRGAVGYRSALYEKHAYVRETSNTTYVLRAMSVSLLFADAAVLFLLDFTVDGFDVLFAPVFALCVIFSLMALGGADKKMFPPVVLSVCFLFASAFETVLSLRYGKAVFRLIGGEYSRVADENAVLSVQSLLALWLTAAVLIIEGVLFVWLWRGYILRFSDICRQNAFGNHDRALIRTAVCLPLAFAVKTVAAISRLMAAYFAADKDVAAYIGARIRLTEQAMKLSAAENPRIASFETAQTVAQIAGIAAIVMAVLAVFALTSLRAETVGREEEA